jgi:hypothetical protein
MPYLVDMVLVVLFVACVMVTAYLWISAVPRNPGKEIPPAPRSRRLFAHPSEVVDPGMYGLEYRGSVADSRSLRELAETTDREAGGVEGE